MDSLDEVKATLALMSKDLTDIKRGVYGDPINKVRGLIETDLEQHQRLTALEDTKKKFFWLATAFVTFLEGTVHFSDIIKMFMK